jgi:uncharacterized membrane protein YfcA
MFGVGGRWALVPVLNLIMSLPIKVAVASSEASLCIGEAASVWVYFHHGALAPHMFIAVVPLVVLGARLGSKVALKIRARIIRYIVITIMVISGYGIMFYIMVVPIALATALKSEAVGIAKALIVVITILNILAALGLLKVH